MDTKEHSRIREHGTVVTNPADFPDPGLARITAVRTIVREKQFATIDGVMVDLYSASAILSVYNALHETNQATYRALPVQKMATIAFQLVT